MRDKKIVEKSVVSLKITIEFQPPNKCKGLLHFLC